MSQRYILAIAAVWLGALISPAPVGAQNAPVQPAPQQVLPPATKLEAFKPAAGSLVTVGYTDLGRAGGVSVDVREHRDGRSAAVRGLVVEVRESQYREARSFVDQDEIAELIRGLDALLEVTSNPTQFTNFEVRYNTRGELRLTAFNNSRNEISYAVEAGRGVKAQAFLDAGNMRRLRDMFAQAQTRLGGGP